MPLHCLALAAYSILKPSMTGCCDHCISSCDPNHDSICMEDNSFIQYTILCRIRSVN